MGACASGGDTGPSNAAPPSDAIVLFDGKNLDEWVSVKDKSPAQWLVADGALTVNKSAGNIETKRSFRNYQLHIEWKIPENITGTDQARGNSGVFLASTGPGDAGYELQVLDSYNNKTYVNGQAGSIYKQGIPLVNPNRKPGEWQTYDVVWSRPRIPASCLIIIQIEEDLQLISGVTGPGGALEKRRCFRGPDRCRVLGNLPLNVELIRESFACFRCCRRSSSRSARRGEQATGPATCP